MMLRASSENDIGEDLNLRAIVDGAATDSGVPHSSELINFVEAALTGTPDLAVARTALSDAVGAHGMVDAAAVIGNFQRMTRIADTTGIPVDEVTAAITADMRKELGLNEFASARLPT
jgi:hypothetical protein